MRRHKVLTTIAVLAVVIIAVSVAASQSSKKAPITGQQTTVVGANTATPPQNAHVGQALRVTGYRGVDATVTLERVSNATAGRGDIAEPPKNGHYVALDVLVAVTGGRYDFNPLYFKWQEPDGTTRSSGDGNAWSAGFDPSLGAGTLTAGQRSRGYVVFDAAAVHGVVQLTDPLGSVVGQWQI